MSEPLIPVSVIVPNFNSGAYLTESIASINDGQWPLEILIIDDCSTDGSFDLALKLQAEYSNIRVLKNAVNSGIAETRRAGLTAATQELIALVDADDRLEAGALSDAYSTIVSSGADMCLWEMWRFDERKIWRHTVNPVRLPLTGAEAVLLTLGGWRIHPSGISRKILYEKAYRGFNEPMVNADELLTRLAFSHATSIVGCQKRYFYRVNPLSSSYALSPRRLSELRSHLWLLDFACCFPVSPSKETIREMIHQAISDGLLYWRHRKQIGSEQTRREINDFLSGICQVPGLWPSLWRQPKCLAAFAVLSIAVRIPL